MPPQGDLVRLRLLEEVRRRPGLPLPEAAAQLGLHASTVAYHVRILERRRLLLAQRGGRRVALFLPGQGACAWMRGVLPALRDAEVRAAATLLLRGPLAPCQVRGRLGLRRSRAARVVHRLLDAGALERVDRGVFRVPEARAACLARALAGQRCAAGGACEAAQSRTLTLRPSPSGRMSVSTPGVVDASALYRRTPSASGLGSASESAAPNQNALSATTSPPERTSRMASSK